MTCTVCRDPRFRHLRKEWGCDHDVERPHLRIECHMCNKFTRVIESRERPDGSWTPEKRCTHCDGQGVINIHRCPWTFVGPQELAMIDGALLIESGVSPFPRHAYDDWPNLFWDSAQIVNRQLRDIQRPDPPPRSKTDDRV